MPRRMGPHALEPFDQHSPFMGGMTVYRRIDGFAELADYAVLSDGRTSALLALDGQVDWWALPALDDLPVCGALLDPIQGGHIFLRPDDSFEMHRRYIDATNVIETTFTTERGTVVITSALNTGASGRLPWTELVFSTVAVGGPVRMTWGTARLWCRASARFRSSPWMIKPSPS
jgi:GH15 family glucan-1,4-alpha-glucosidase